MTHRPPMNYERRVVLAWLGLLLGVVSVWDIHTRGKRR